MTRKKSEISLILERDRAKSLYYTMFEPFRRRILINPVSWKVAQDATNTVFLTIFIWQWINYRQTMDYAFLRNLNIQNVRATQTTHLNQTHKLKSCGRCYEHCFPNYFHLAMNQFSSNYTLCVSEEFKHTKMCQDIQRPIFNDRMAGFKISLKLYILCCFFGSSNFINKFLYYLTNRFLLIFVNTRVYNFR